jgi:hypothetical protein
MEAPVAALHDLLRPRIIREPSVQVLSDLCDVLLGHIAPAAAGRSRARLHPP